MNAIRHQTLPDFSKLVGVPYSEKDCWQLVKAFYNLVFNTELKHYYKDTPPDLHVRKNLIYSNMGDFLEVKGTPKFGDIILLKVRGIESHIGVYVGEGRMLHTAIKTGSIIDRVSRWDKVIVGFYRLSEEPSQ